MLRSTAFHVVKPHWSVRRGTVSRLRLLSSESKKPPAEEAAQTKEIVMTPGEKVAAASRLTMWGGIGVFAAICAYYIGAELMPT